MAWIRTISWSSKLSYSDCMKHFRKEQAPMLAESPATSMQMIQTGPNSGMMIQHFENKRALNEHEKTMAEGRKAAAKAMKMRMTVTDGEVRWSR